MTVDDSNQTFKTRDAASYDPVVNQFDQFSDLYTDLLAEHVVDLAELSADAQILDIGTGTGIVALKAARKLTGTGFVAGIDLSTEMLAIAARKAADQDLGDRIRYSTQDAENLEFEDGSFDVVLSLFALLHFPAPDRALREMFRVLRPGGKLVLAVGGGPSRLSRIGMRDGFQRLRALSEKIRGLRLEAPQFLDRIVREHTSTGTETEESSLARSTLSRSSSVPRLIREAGFTNIESDWVGQSNVIESQDAFWDLQATYSSFSRKRLDSAEESEKRAIRREFDNACESVLLKGGKLVYPCGAIYVTGIRP